MSVRRYSMGVYGFGMRPFEEALAEAAMAGFDACEFRQNELDMTTSAGVSDARRILNAHGVRALTMHSKGGGSLANLDSSLRVRAIDHATGAFEGFAALGGFAVIIHPGYPLKDGETAQAQIDAFRRSATVLAERAAAAGIRVALENLPIKSDKRPRPLSRMEDLRRVVDELPPTVGICLDTGHAVLNGFDPAEEARIAGDRLIALHLHDADIEIDHWIPGEKAIDWPALNTALTAIQFDGAWTFEAINANLRDGTFLTAQRCRAVADAWDAALLHRV